MLGVRKKADRILRENERTFRRIRMDIRDCYIPAIPDALGFKAKENEGKSFPIVIAAKHLCGVATDFAFSALETFVEVSEDRSSRPRIHGYAIASCCHHACVWEEYVGAFWFENIGFSSQEFEVLSSWTGWQSICRTCEARQPKSFKAESLDEINDEIDEEDHAVAVRSVARPRDLRSEEMIDIGYMSKRLIDQGRVEYLVQHGFRACQQRYCPPDYSPECILIIARSDRD